MAKIENVARELTATIGRLQQERKTHMDAIARIDATFSQFGIRLHDGRRPGRPPASASMVIAAPKRKRRGRGTFEKSGLESVLEFVKATGKSGATTAEINKHWESEGRAANAYAALGKLVRNRKLKKRSLPGQRGTRYRFF